jgi:carbamoyltransferase
MRVLGINTSHNASIAEIEDGDLVSFYEEARFNRVKNFEPSAEPYRFLSIDQKIDLNSVDAAIATSYGRKNPTDPHGAADLAIVRYLSDQLGIGIEFYAEHHLYHALTGFYFSELDEALCLVMDGGGAQVLQDRPFFQEVESAYYVTRDEVTSLYKHLTNRRFLTSDPDVLPEPETFYRGAEEIKLSSLPSSGMNFATLACALEMFTDEHDAGKLMGLAAYGRPGEYTAAGVCARLQQDTEEATVQFIADMLEKADTKNVVLSGGYALNCTNNFKYTKRFPNINFFVDPCAHDMGTAVGAALWRWRQHAHN